MNKRRLLKLADMLEADAKNKKGMQFDIGDLGSVKDGAEAGVHCGTTGCAMGLAAVSGEFRRAGLSYIMLGSAIRTTVNDERCDYKEAATLVFDISYDQAWWLFSPNSYGHTEGVGAKGERLVAKRIRDLAAGKAPPRFR